MTFQVEIIPIAEAQIERAYRWYRDRNPATVGKTLSTRVQHQVAIKLSIRQFFKASNAIIAPEKILKGGTVFADVVYFQ